MIRHRDSKLHITDYRNRVSSQQRGKSAHLTLMTGNPSCISYYQDVVVRLCGSGTSLATRISWKFQVEPERMREAPFSPTTVLSCSKDQT